MKLACLITWALSKKGASEEFQKYTRNGAALAGIAESSRNMGVQRLGVLPARVDTADKFSFARKMFYNP